MADNDAPVQDAPQEPAQPQEPQTPEPVQPEEPQTPEEPTQEPQQPSQANEGADAPEPQDNPTPPPSDPEFDPLDGYTDVMPQQQYNFEAQDDGTVDPYQVAAQMEDRLLKKIRFEQQEARAWNKIEERHGDKLNDNVRQMIRDRRIADALQGKNGNLSKIADTIVSELSGARAAGRADATTSTKVQRAASLETTTANSGPSKSEDLMSRLEMGDKAATTDLLAQWLEEGKLGRK